MNRWIETVRALEQSDDPAMLVTVLDVRGSAPRECGAKMLVTASDLAGSIGGGELEYRCARIAVERLREREGAAASTFVQRFPLGASCGQCCGGVVEVLFEQLAACTAWVSDLSRIYDRRVPVVVATALQADGTAHKFLVTAGECRAYGTPPQELRAAVETNTQQLLAEPAGARLLRLPGFLLFLEPLMSSNFNLALFGAGHVGSAVVAAMAALDCNIRWIDSRREIFPARVPAGVTCIESGSPALEVAAMPPGSFYLVMTHSHPLDFEICSRILSRNDFAYCGLIGSNSKRRRFERLMRKQGMQDAVLERLTCPIGVAGIESKKPEAIAIAVAAELLQKQCAAAASHAPSASHLIRAL
jgi:xanthine dehydrogenase accessory factor